MLFAFPSTAYLLVTFGLLFVPPAFLAGYAVGRQRLSGRFAGIACFTEAASLMAIWLVAHAT